MVVERDDSPVVEGQAAEVRTAAARREDVLLFRQLRSGERSTAACQVMACMKINTHEDSRTWAVDWLGLWIRKSKMMNEVEGRWSKGEGAGSIYPLYKKLLDCKTG